MNRNEFEKALANSLLENNIKFDFQKVERFTRIVIYDMIHNDDFDSEYIITLMDDTFLLNDGRIYIEYPINQITFSIKEKAFIIRLSSSPKKVITFPIFQQEKC